MFRGNTSGGLNAIGAIEPFGYEVEICWIEDGHCAAGKAVTGEACSGSNTMAEDIIAKRLTSQI